MPNRAPSSTRSAQSLVRAWEKTGTAVASQASEAAWVRRLDTLWQDPHQDDVIAGAAKAAGPALLAALRAEAGHRQDRVDDMPVEIVLVGLPVSGRIEDLEQALADLAAFTALTDQATELLDEQGYQACLWIPIVCSLDAVSNARPGLLRGILTRMADSVLGDTPPPSPAEVRAWSDALGHGRHGTQMLIGVTFADPEVVAGYWEDMQASEETPLPIGWFGTNCYAGGPEAMEGAVQAAVTQHLLLDLCVQGHWTDADRVLDAMTRMDALQDGAAMFGAVEMKNTRDGGLMVRAHSAAGTTTARVPGPLDPDLLDTLSSELASITEPSRADWTGMALDGSVMEVMSRVVDGARTPETMEKVQRMLAQPPLALVPTGSARKAWVDAARIWLAASGSGPHAFDAPCTVLARVLTAARRRDGDVWRVLVYHGQERASFAEDNWPYLLGFALSGAYPQMSVVLRRILPLSKGPCRVLVAVLSIRGMEVQLLSGRDVAKVYGTDAETGKPRPIDPEESYVDVPTLLPGIEEMFAQESGALRH